VISLPTHTLTAAPPALKVFRTCRQGKTPCSNRCCCNKQHNRKGDCSRPTEISRCHDSDPTLVTLLLLLLLRGWRPLLAVQCSIGVVGLLPTPLRLLLLPSLLLLEVWWRRPLLLLLLHAKGSLRGCRGTQRTPGWHHGGMMTRGCRGVHDGRWTSSPSSHHVWARSRSRKTGTWPTKLTGTWTGSGTLPTSPRGGLWGWL